MLSHSKCRKVSPPAKATYEFIDNLNASEKLSENFDSTITKHNSCPVPMPFILLLNLLLLPVSIFGLYFGHSSNAHSSSFGVPGKNVDSENRHQIMELLGPHCNYFSSPGSMRLVDVWVGKLGTIAIINTKKKVWTNRNFNHVWKLIDIDSRKTYEGRKLDIQTHGHSAIVTFGKNLTAGIRVQIFNDNELYGIMTLQYPFFHGRSFFLTVALFTNREPDTRWLDWYLDNGVEHFLIYWNAPNANNDTFQKSFSIKFSRFPVTLIPFWYTPHVSFGDQQAAYMHALWTLKGISKWIIAVDLDEYIMTKKPLRKLLEGSPPNTHALQFESHNVVRGEIREELGYRNTKGMKGKVIFNTETTLAHSVHMVTDAIGGGKMSGKCQRCPGNHLHVSAEDGILAHFKRTERYTAGVDKMYHRYATDPTWGQKHFHVIDTNYCRRTCSTNEKHQTYLNLDAF